MIRFGVGALAAILLATVGYVGFCAWIAFATPGRPVSHYEYASECEKIVHHSNAYLNSPQQCQMRLFEAVRLQRHPGLAIRDGENLTIYYQGKAISRLVATVHDQSDDECNTFDVGKVLNVYDPAARSHQNLAEVYCHQGEFEKRFIVLPDGSRWPVSDASSSPDGQLIGVGSNKNAGLSGFTLLAWPKRNIVARFAQGCRVIGWQDSSHLTVTCFRTDLDHDAEYDWRLTPLAFDASVWRDDDGIWQMQATRWLGSQDGHMAFNDYRDLEYRRMFSLQWLPHYTARTS